MRTTLRSSSSTASWASTTPVGYSRSEAVVSVHGQRAAAGHAAVVERRRRARRRSSVLGEIAADQVIGRFGTSGTGRACSAGRDRPVPHLTIAFTFTTATRRSPKRHSSSPARPNHRTSSLSIRFHTGSSTERQIGMPREADESTLEALASIGAGNTRTASMTRRAVCARG